MKISLPDEPVVYYECSSSSFRLVYFLPLDRLKQLCNNREAGARLCADFPDGVDLACNRADFRDFERSYELSLPIDAEWICHAFFAVLSCTRAWRSFRGSGLIPVRDLQSHRNIVADIVGEAPIHEPSPDQPVPPIARRQRRARAAKVTQELREAPIPGIDGHLDLRRQRFSEVKWTRGDSAQDVFSRLHDSRRDDHVR